MTSILTNTGAMTALQTLKTINKDLGSVQEQIASGKKVGNAKDNAAVWAVSKVMEADVAGFKKISEGLAVGGSTVAVARNAAETTTKLLTQMKERIVQANDPAQANNLTKIQADIAGFRDQIGSVVAAAQFNGVNLVGGTGSIEVLASLDRTAGGVTASKINVSNQDLSFAAYAPKAAFTGTTGASTAGDTAAFTIAGAASANLVMTNATYAAGDSISVRIGDKTVSHTFSASDVAATSPQAAGATALRTKIEALGIPGLTVGYDSAAPGTLAINNTGATDLSVSAQFKNVGSGGLSELTGIDVTSNLGTALASVESALQTSINAAAAFGTAQNRIETQSDFVGKLSDSLTAGVGSMVDADMEEASARLQALQTQQQLGIQALSIANQGPGAVMALFR
ncbi:flagellin [Paracoccus haeundaensis]|uniref:Flagellin n=1 Tax=Paracoccus haeundaensis TaxID=225362 RepID=A0A5C4R112_9RHOB|nr:flagellin [Paracoccus haeundaensis]TNH37531.1 flagellin [Paracoccus haeundaensis]